MKEKEEEEEEVKEVKDEKTKNLEEQVQGNVEKKKISSKMAEYLKKRISVRGASEDMR